MQQIIRIRRAVALGLAAAMLTPTAFSLTGCSSTPSGGGSGNSASTATTTNTTPPPPGAPMTAAASGSPTAAVAAHHGMTAKQKVALVAGAALLYYLYKKHQAAQQNAGAAAANGASGAQTASAASGAPAQLYRSKNGGIYYRDPQNPQHVIWVTAPPQPVAVPVEELQRYAPDWQQYQNQTAPSAPSGQDSVPATQYDPSLAAGG